MTLHRGLPDDEADFRLLSLADRTRKFVMQLGYVLESEFQCALERGIDNDWFTLVDVTTTPELPGKVFRVFRLTDAGMKRLAVLAAQAAARERRA